MAKGKPIDMSKVVSIDHLRGKKIKNRIFRVGVELEGGWKTLPNGTRVMRDGSLDNWHAPPDTYQKGELASEPREPNKVEEWMQKYYPHYVSPQCGLHVHISVTSNITYQRLMDERYVATVLHYLNLWARQQGLAPGHPLWSRLRGESVYCQLLFQADEQVRNTNKDYDREREGHRYTACNFSFTRHGTIEHRILPMMESVEQGWSAVKEIIDVTNMWLVATAKRERKFIADVDGDVTPERYVLVEQV